MNMYKPFVRLISIVLLAAILHACSPYLVREIPKEPLPAFEKRTVNLLWPGQEGMHIKLTDVYLEGDALKGHADRYLEKDPYNYGNLWINVYLTDQVQKPKALPCEMSFDISQIKKIEVYDTSTWKVIGNIILLTGAELVIMGLAYALIMALKESCPFVYTWNGEDYALAGETYSGAIFPSMERHDYLPLPNLKPDSGIYKLKLTNEVKEEQYTNLAELIVVDHPAQSSVLLDKDGACLFYSNPRPPISAISADGTDLMELLGQKDELRYLGGQSSDQEPGSDAVTLTFKRPPGTQTANLLLRGKSSFWLDYTLVKWFDCFGSMYDSWYKQQAKKPKGHNQNWTVEQGIQLSVYIEKNGAWEFVDYLNVTGPMADRDLMMPLDLKGIDGEDVKVMLKSGFMFWEYDYAALGFSGPAEANLQVLPLRTAIDQYGKDVSPLMAKDDGKYQAMKKIGDEVLLTFIAPPEQEGLQRTVFLHGKGHYKILRDPKGKPDIAYLKEFRQPGRIGLFSREQYLELKSQTAKRASASDARHP